MTYLDKQEFLAWAYDDLLANTTRGVLAEYIVAKALGTLDTKRVEWDKYDLRVGDIGVEVKSAAYVQSWGTRPSTISFDISTKMGWDASTNTYAASAERRADVYVFCLKKEDAAAASCRFRFSMAEFRFRWRMDGGSAGKLLAQAN